MYSGYRDLHFKDDASSAAQHEREKELALELGKKVHELTEPEWRSVYQYETKPEPPAKKSKRDKTPPVTPGENNKEN